MNEYYLGYVEYISKDRLIGRIRPLATLKKRSSDDAWVVDRAYESGDLGGTDRVFWPKIPRDQDGLTEQYVRFRVEFNQKTQDSEREWHDFVVAAERQNEALRRVATLGIPILHECRVFGPDHVLESSHGLRPEATVYRRRLKDTFINGPWRIAKLGDPPRHSLQPKEDGYIVEYRIDNLDSDSYHVWDEDHRETHMVFLAEPSKGRGHVIDLLPNSGLAGWLSRVLKKDRPLLAKLELASPGWRGRVGDLLAAAADPVQRELERSRFLRLEPALDALADDEARLDDLAELPRFKELLNVAIDRQVAVRREKIEADARAESDRVVAQASQARDQAKAVAEREKQTLRHEIEKVRTELADTERLREEARAKIAADESTIRAAADYLVESRERIIRDFSAFHELIKNTQANGDGLANRHPPAVVKVLDVPLSMRLEVDPEGPAIDDPDVFLHERLAPLMAAWGTEATFEQAKRLHAALLACRWVATPCPSWGAAYVEAMGVDARHRIVAVEPMWLAFSDVWGGEVEAFWREAVERRETLHLLIFADADRALVQCWARPMLDVVSGLRPTLPSGLPWPENLRVMACPSADEAALPVPKWVVAHWAGVKAASYRPDGPIIPGHVPFAAWSAWVMTPDNTSRPSVGLGVAARSAAMERSALARIFHQLDLNGDPEDAKEVARQVREVDARSVFSKEIRA